MLPKNVAKNIRGWYNKRCKVLHIRKGSVEMKLSIEQIKVINDRLRAFDPGWVKSKDQFGGKPAQNYLDNQTVTQILNYATYGITTWDFSLEDQWREEVHKKDKQSNQWIFDGYVYHVKGTLTIEGLGSRSQFGKKIATGGATGQDMSYQSAASNALSKCASLFGVGEALYIPQNQIITQAFTYDETMRLLGHTFQQQQSVIQQPIQAPVVDQVQQEIEQMFAPVQQQIPMQQAPNAFIDSQMPTTFGAPQPIAPQANWDDQSATWMPPVDTNNTQVSLQPTQADIQFMKENNVPFGNAQTQPQVSPFEQQAPQQVQPTQIMGPPINVVQEPVQVKQEPVQVKQEPIETQGSNEQQKFMQQITVYKQHKERLGLTEDAQMLPYLRDYFKDENASTQNLNIETIVGFNEYMLTIQV